MYFELVFSDNEGNPSLQRACQRWLEQYDEVSAQRAAQNDVPYVPAQWETFRETAKLAMLFANDEKLDLTIDILKNLQGVIQFYGKGLFFEEEYNETKKERFLCLLTRATRLSFYVMASDYLCLALYYDLYK